MKSLQPIKIEDIVSVEGVDHLRDRLYVHWDITTMCNYDCSYCYAKAQYGDKWQIPAIWKKQLEVIDELEKSTLPLFLGLLGGEPTMHQRYFQLLDLLEEKILKHPDSRLYITTNGSKSNEFFEKHKDSDGRTYVLWSIHAEYMNEETFKNVFENIKIMHKKGYKNKLNLMLHPAKKYWEFTKYMYNELNTLEYLRIHPHFIYGGINKDVQYNKDFYEYFNFLENQRMKEFEYKTKSETFILSDYEIFKNNLNEFKGWKCWQNNYEISSNCLISDQCFNRDWSEISFNFFKNITKIESKICPHNFCSCDGLMKIHKEKNE